MQVTADGAITIGGPDHRHSSNKSAEKLWQTLHPAAGTLGIPLRTSWDNFHKADLGFWRALREVPALLELMDLSKKVDHMFGIGEGVLALHAVGAASQAFGKPRRAAAPGGTRKVGHLRHVPRAVAFTNKDS